MRSFLAALNRPAVAIAAVAVLAGGLRLYHLSSPPSRVFDEVYYSKSGCVFVGYSNRRCDIASSDEKYWVRTKGETGSWVHPPLGKWAIGLGEGLFGTGPLGWRVSAAASGTLSVVVIAVIAQLLFGSPLWTFVSGLLLATENLNFVQSRVSMLDIFLAFWVALGFLFLVLDRRWIERRTPPSPEAAALDPEVPREAALDPEAPRAAESGASEAGTRGAPEPSAPVPSPILRPWRLAAGVAFGAAFATKWSGIIEIASAVFLSFIWEFTRRKRAGTLRSIRRTIQRESFGIVLAFLVVPAVVYVVSYTGWFVRFGFHPIDWFKLQGAMANYHEHLQTINPTTGKPVHPYLSQSWKWLLLWRPVSYFYEESGGLRREILDMGNPAIFWGSVFTIPYLFIAWRRKRDWRAGFLLAAIQYLPWAPVGRPQFFFYITPITPFLVLAATYTLKDLSELHVAGSRSRPYLPVAAGFVAVSVGMFAFFWPILTASPLSPAAWKLRIWFPSWV